MASHDASQLCELTEANVRSVLPQRKSRGGASSVATSSISIHPTNHAVERQTERDVTHREIQSAMRHGVWLPDPEGHRRRHMVTDKSAGVTVIVQDRVTPVTVWRGSFSAGADGGAEERPDSGNSVLEPTLPPDFLKSFSDELASFDEANEYVIDKYGSMGGYGDFLDEQLSSSFLRKLETELDWNLPGDQPGEGSWAQTAQVLSSANMTLEAWPERFR